MLNILLHNTRDPNWRVYTNFTSTVPPVLTVVDLRQCRNFEAHEDIFRTLEQCQAV